jgi:hypothetical protein
VTWKSAKNPPVKTKRGQAHSEPMLVRCVWGDTSWPPDGTANGDLACYGVSRYDFELGCWEWAIKMDYLPVTHWKPFARLKGDK